jgi:hypothetical protein
MGILRQFACLGEGVNDGRTGHDVVNRLIITSGALASDVFNLLTPGQTLIECNYQRIFLTNSMPASPFHGQKIRRQNTESLERSHKHFYESV